MTAATSIPQRTAGISVTLRGVKKVFPSAGGPVPAVNGVDMQIAAGDFVAWLGPSGCGKSTLLRLVAGLDRPTAGEVIVGDATSSTRRSDIAFVFQDANLLPWRNVLRNVALPLELRGARKSERLDAAREAIANVGLDDAMRRYPAQLSGGMKMRVSLARALVTRPRLLLLDEPFAALDELTRQKLDEQLYQLWLSHGMTVIFVTHSISEAIYLAQRAILFSRRPASLVRDQTLDLPRERPVELRTQPRFNEIVQSLYGLLAREAD